MGPLLLDRYNAELSSYQIEQVRVASVLEVNQKSLSQYLVRDSNQCGTVVEALGLVPAFIVQYHTPDRFDGG